MRDELSWHGAKRAWAAESSNRRDDALCSAAQAAAQVMTGVARRAALKSAEDAANSNSSGTSSSVNASTAASSDGSGGDNDNHPAPGVALASGIRLCNLVGVPSNLDGLLRLRRRYLLDRAVVDLVAFRARDTPAVAAAVAKAAAARAKMTAAVRDDPAADLDPAAAADAYAAGLAAASAAASAPISEDAEVLALRNEAAWCECLTVACGAHLHWHLSQHSPEYAAERCRGEAAKPGTSPGGWPPEYDIFAVSLIAPRSARESFRAGVGSQEVAKAVTRQIMAARLEPTMLGLGEDPLVAHAGEALATGSLVTALMRCVGALRARQLKSDHGTHHAAWAISQAEQHRRKVQADGSASSGAAAAATATAAAASPSSPSGVGAASPTPPPTAPAPAAAAAAAAAPSTSAHSDPPGLTFHVDRAVHGQWDDVPLQALDACTFALLGAVWCQFQSNNSGSSNYNNDPMDRGSGSGSFRGDSGSSGNSFDGRSRGAGVNGSNSASSGACPSRKRHGAAVLAAALHIVVHGGAHPSPRDVAAAEPASPLSPGSAKSTEKGVSPAAAGLSLTTSGGGGAVGAAGRALRGLAARLACFLLAREPWLRHSVSSDFGLLPGLARLLWSRDAGLGLCGATLLAACVAHPKDRAQAARVDCAACLSPLLRFILVKQAPRRAGNDATNENDLEGGDSSKAATNNDTSSSSGSSNNKGPRNGRTGPRRASELLASPPPKQRSHNGSSSSISSGSGKSDELVEALRGPDGYGAADALDHAFVALHGLLYALLHNKPSLGEMAARRNARRTGGHDSKHHHHHHHRK